MQNLKWYQVVLIAFGVYAVALVVAKAIETQRALNKIREDMGEDNICLLVKQVKKYDKELIELSTTQTIQLVAVDNSLKIRDIQEKRSALLRLIDSLSGGTVDYRTVYCKPCDCEKHGEEPHGDLPPNDDIIAIANQNGGIADYQIANTNNGGIANHSIANNNNGGFDRIRGNAY